MIKNIEGITDLSNYYTKPEVDQKLSEVEVDLSDYYNKEEVEAIVEEANNNCLDYYSLDIKPGEPISAEDIAELEEIFFRSHWGSDETRDCDFLVFDSNVGLFTTMIRFWRGDTAKYHITFSWNKSLYQMRNIDLSYSEDYYGTPHLHETIWPQYTDTNLQSGNVKLAASLSPTGQDTNVGAAIKYLADNYALKTDIPDTSGFTTMEAVEEKGYQTEEQVNALIEASGFTTMDEVEAKGYQTEEQVNALIEASGGSGGGGSVDIDVFGPAKAAGAELVNYQNEYGAPDVYPTQNFISEFNLQNDITYYLYVPYQYSNTVWLGTTLGGTEITSSSLNWNANNNAIVYDGELSGISARNFHSQKGNYIAFKLTSASAGSEGLVPAPSETDTNKFLCSDGTWQTNGPIVMGTYNEIFNDSTAYTLTGLQGSTTCSYNHIEGKGHIINITSSDCFHVEGKNHTVSGSFKSSSHIEGFNNTVSSGQSHTEGRYNTNKSDYSHIEGERNETKASNTHAEGYYTLASSSYQHVQGKYNIEDAANTYADIVGNGSSSARANAYTLDWSGNATFAGTITSASGADYAEYFEWFDGNPDGEDRVGYIVKLNGDKIELANEDDDILGVISGTMTVLGDNAEWHWQGKYLTDDFGRIIYEQKEAFSTTINQETGEEETVSIGFFPVPKINPAYDESKPYVNRKERPEWDAVGMMGKLYVRDDGTAQVNDYVVPFNGVATAAIGRTNMRVMERISDNIIRVCLK